MTCCVLRERFKDYTRAEKTVESFRSCVIHLSSDLCYEEDYALGF